MSIQLTTEQQFALQRFSRQVTQLSLEEAQDRLIELYTQSLEQEARYLSLLGKAWGIPNP